MTGFARAEGALGARRWAWEVKSVNGKTLDLRFRLPPGLDGIELPARQAAQRRFKRGNLTLNLRLDQETGTGALRVNRAALDQLLPVLSELRAQGFAAPSADGILALRGVIETEAPIEDEAARSAFEATVLESFDLALVRLERARREEGARLGGVLGSLVDEIALLTDRAGSLAALRPEAMAARLKAQLRALLEAEPALPADRVAQEAALLAVKGDVREELDRLAAHVAQARQLLAEGEGAGRRLDFLAQEFNREANTLCSKANDLELTRIGLDLKLAADRLKEQVANLE